jgi:hypothetical protein
VRPHKFNTIFLPLPHILPPETLTVIFSSPVSVGEQAIRIKASDKKCGLAVRVHGYTSRGPGFGSQRYQIFREVVGLERGPLSLVSITEELLE